MADFSTSLLNGIIGGNGLTKAISNLYTMPYAIKNAEAQARYRGAQEARMRQQMMQADEAKQNLIASQNWFAEQMGVPAEALRGYSPQELGQMFANTQKGQMMAAAGMLNPVQRAVTAAQHVTAPKPDQSISEDASVTPPISALRLGKSSYIEAPAPDSSAQAVSNQNMQRNGELLSQLLRDNSMINHAMSGGSMYNAGRNGAAFNPYTGEQTIYDPAAYSQYNQKVQAQINKANRPPQKRGGGGGRGHITYGKSYIAADGSERQRGSNGIERVITRPKRSGGGGSFKDDVPGI